MNLNILEVRRLLKEKSKTQKQFARMLGMDAGQLSNTLNGVHQASYPTISRMADALEVPVDRLIMDMQMGEYLNDAVNSRHKVSIAVMNGAMAIFDREYQRYIVDELNTDDFLGVLNRLDNLVGEGVLPTADALLEYQPDDSRLGDRTEMPRGKVFKGKLQGRPTEDV